MLQPTCRGYPKITNPGHRTPPAGLETGTYNGVKACGPGPTQGGTDHLVHFYSGAWGEYEWECVELVMRYMYQAYGIPPYSAPGGKDVVANYPGTGTTVLTKVNNDGTSLPTPGDILSYAASSYTDPTYGHTAVVTGVNVDANGNGTVTVMQQNASANGWGSVTVTNHVLGMAVSGWLHNPNYTAPSSVKSLNFAVTSDGTYHVFDGENNGMIHETYWKPGNQATTYPLVNDGATQVTSTAFAVTSDGTYHMFSGTSGGKSMRRTGRRETQKRPTR